MKRQIQSNPRLLFWGRAFFEVKMLTSVIVLFYIHRGMTLDEVFYMSIVWAVAALATEVPSGYLADKIGRKHTLILGVLLMLVATAFQSVAHGPWMFALIFALMSSAFSCFSGTDEALLYESLKANGQEHEMTKHNGRLMSARTLFKLVIPLVCALVARDLLDWQFQILIWVNVFAVAIALYFLVRITEPPRSQSVFEKEVGVFRHSLVTIKTQPWLLRASLNKILVFISVFIVWRMAQPVLEGAGLDVLLLGVFDVIGYMILFSMRWYTGAIVKRFGVSRYVAITGWLGALFILVGIVSHNLWIDFASLVLAIGIMSGREPAFAHAINHRIESRSRATTLSNLNVLKSMLDIPIYFIVGRIAMLGYDQVLVLAAVICVGALLAFPLKEEELAPTNIAC